jgi:hypothetical protein
VRGGSFDKIKPTICEGVSTPRGHGFWRLCFLAALPIFKCTASPTSSQRSSSNFLAGQKKVPLSKLNAITRLTITSK